MIFAAVVGVGVVVVVVDVFVVGVGVVVIVVVLTLTRVIKPVVTGQAPVYKYTVYAMGLSTELRPFHFS